MFIKKILKIAVGITFLLSVAGCGENSNTNGDLALTVEAVPDNSTGLVLLKATATVTPAAAGTEVSLTAVQYYTESGQYIAVPNSGKDSMQPTNDKGIAIWSPTFAQQAAYATTVFVTASLGGLSRTELVSIEKFTAP